MSLRVIGAGLGRTGTLSLKLALEHIGLGPCYHMSEMLANMRSHLPLWLDATRGETECAAIFSGYQSTCDYPGCTYWRALAQAYPDAKIVLTVRDPDSWFESVSATIFSDEHRARFEGNPMMAEFIRSTIFNQIDPIVKDKEALIAFFNDWNRSVIDEVPPERLLVYQAKDGWGPLCEFLGVPVPAEPYPRVNSRHELSERTGEIDVDRGPPPPEAIEVMARAYIDDLKLQAFPTMA